MSLMTKQPSALIGFLTLLQHTSSESVWLREIRCKWAGLELHEYCKPIVTFS